MSDGKKFFFSFVLAAIFDYIGYFLIGMQWPLMTSFVVCAYGFRTFTRFVNEGKS